MKKIAENLKAFIITLVIFTGVVFCCGFTFRVPRGVAVDGVEVGGKSYSQACKILRADSVDGLKGKRLRIYAGGKEYAFSYPEIDFTDDISKILHESKKGGAYTSTRRYYLKGEDDFLKLLQADICREKIEPCAEFNAEGEPFTYYEGQDGAGVDINKLKEDINYSLNNGFTPVYAAVKGVPRTETMEDIKERTRLLYSFSTEYDASNTARAHNIALACVAVNGTIIADGGVFSFNQVVGARTKERGYMAAKIISGGKYITGLGGGVCQVSTTLYNAVLLSGQKIIEQHPHSLGVSYVQPSRDAMVSGSYYDFKFKNVSGYPLYIRAAASGGRVTCSVYGKSDGWNYSFQSSIVATLSPPEPEYGAEVEITARDGARSEGYLIKQRGGVIIKQLIRKDTYAPLRGATKEQNPTVPSWVTDSCFPLFF